MTPQPTSKTPLTDALVIELGAKIGCDVITASDACLELEKHARTLETSLADANEKLEVARRKCDEAYSNLRHQDERIRQQTIERDSALAKIRELEKLIACLRRDLSNPPADVQELVIKKLNLVAAEQCDSLRQQLEVANLHVQSAVGILMKHGCANAAVEIIEHIPNVANKVSKLLDLTEELKAHLEFKEQERTSLQKQLNVANSFIGSVAESLGLEPTVELPEITARLNHSVAQNTKLREAALTDTEKVCKLWLCESRSLVLKPNQEYIFIVDDHCDACKAIEKEALNQKDNEK